MQDSLIKYKKQGKTFTRPANVAEKTNTTVLQVQQGVKYILQDGRQDGRLYLSQKISIRKGKGRCPGLGLSLWIC